MNTVCIANFFVSISSVVLCILQTASHFVAHSCSLTTVFSESGSPHWTSTGPPVIPLRVSCPSKPLENSNSLLQFVPYWPNHDCLHHGYMCPICFLEIASSVCSLFGKFNWRLFVPLLCRTDCPVRAFFPRTTRMNRTADCFLLQRRWIITRTFFCTHIPPNDTKSRTLLAVSLAQPPFLVRSSRSKWSFTVLRPWFWN